MKFKLFYFILALFLVVAIGSLSSCGVKKKNIGADGYYFEQETFTHTSFPVEVVLVQTDEEMIKLIREAKNVQGEVDPKLVAAFSSIRPTDGRCKVYMIDPKVRYDPQWIGHEFVHCVYGIWHHEPQAGR